MWEILLQRCALTNRSSSNVRLRACANCDREDHSASSLATFNVDCAMAALQQRSHTLYTCLQYLPWSFRRRHRTVMISWNATLAADERHRERERARRVRLGKTRPEMPDRYTTRRSGDLRVIRSVGDFAHERARRTPWVVGGRLSHLDLNIRVVAHHVLAADREWTSKKHKHITIVLRWGSQRFVWALLHRHTKIFEPFCLHLPTNRRHVDKVTRIHQQTSGSWCLSLALLTSLSRSAPILFFSSKFFVRVLSRYPQDEQCCFDDVASMDRVQNGDSLCRCFL